MAKKIKKEQDGKYMLVDGVVFKVDLVKTPATGDLFLEERSVGEQDGNDTIVNDPAPEPSPEPASPTPEVKPDQGRVKIHRRAFSPEEYDRMKAEGKVVSIASDDGAIGREAIARQVPSQDETPEKKREAQKARASKYGIEALETGANLSYPSGDPTTEALYGDPVNLKYPLGYDDNKVSLARSNNARARFKQNASAYSQEKSKKIIHTRVVEAQIKAGANPSYNPDDSLDKLLPSSLVNKMEGSTVEREVTGMEELVKKFEEAIGALKTATEGLTRASAVVPTAQPTPPKEDTTPKGDDAGKPEDQKVAPPDAPTKASGEEKKPAEGATPDKPSPAVEPAKAESGENNGELKAVVNRMADSIQSLTKAVTDVASKVDTISGRVDSVERTLATPGSSPQDATEEPTPVERSKKNIWAPLFQ